MYIYIYLANLVSEKDSSMRKLKGQVQTYIPILALKVSSTGIYDPEHNGTLS